MQLEGAPANEVQTLLARLVPKHLPNASYQIQAIAEMCCGNVRQALWDADAFIVAS